MKKLSIIFLFLLLPACSDSGVENIKAHANDTWKSNGFSVVGYQGYQWGMFGNYGGCVWYTVERNGVTYNGCISQWGNEYHIYSLKAYDAIGSR